MAELHTGPWNMATGYPEKNGLKVFSCFHCGGGSTMGYKLAGFDVIGGVEIDPEMMSIYKANHSPTFPYLMGVEEFNKTPDANLPAELFNLDILDGSPPCSSFSSNGSRDKAWGEKKKFREGQANQILDDLFFHFIATAKKLKPKVVVAENVKGLIQGNARGYVKQIFSAFRDAGYTTQLFLLNSSRMGVPQARERTFFIANKINKKMKLDFNEEPILFSQIKEKDAYCKLSPELKYLWDNKKTSDIHIGMINLRMNNKSSRFSTMIQKDNKVSYTVTAGMSNVLYSEPRHLTDNEIIRCQSFPNDYNFLKQKPVYVCGMSVPPFMTQRVANQIHKQLLS